VVSRRRGDACRFRARQPGSCARAQLARVMSRYERPLRVMLAAALLAVGVWDVTANLPIVG
jgi:hypothetical protein